jgi:antitoxin component of MazEF toxin-antitoxin module
MLMEKRTRQVDARARAILFQDFAGSTVLIERIGPHELRIRKVRTRKRKYSLKELAERITAKNRHAETVTGSPVGGEAW